MHRLCETVVDAMKKLATNHLKCAKSLIPLSLKKGQIYYCLRGPKERNLVCRKIAFRCPKLNFDLLTHLHYGFRNMKPEIKSLFRGLK